MQVACPGVEFAFPPRHRVRFRGVPRVGTLDAVTAQIDLRPEAIVIRFPGAEPLLTLQRSLTLPWADVVSARVDRQDVLKRDLGLRVGGGYFPGWFATGHYTYRGRKGERQLWCAYRAPEVLVIETRRAKPRRIVLQEDEPTAVADRINGRIRPAVHGQAPGPGAA